MYPFTVGAALLPDSSQAQQPKRLDLNVLQALITNYNAGGFPWRFV
jgi:hypothetical protein